MKKKATISHSKDILVKIRGNFVWTPDKKKAIFEADDNGKFVMAVLK